jgi:hypothetical protein
MLILVVYIHIYLYPNAIIDQMFERIKYYALIRTVLLNYDVETAKKS